jgi:hypothetical protein
MANHTSGSTNQFANSFSIRLDDLRPHFHLPVREAAAKLGVCHTTLKAVCRRLNIARWPHVKFKVLDKRLGVLDEALRSTDDPVLRNKIADSVQHIRAAYEILRENPNVLVDDLLTMPLLGGSGASASVETPQPRSSQMESPDEAGRQPVLGMKRDVRGAPVNHVHQTHQTPLPLSAYGAPQSSWMPPQLGPLSSLGLLHALHDPSLANNYPFGGAHPMPGGFMMPGNGHAHPHSYPSSMPSAYAAALGMYPPPPLPSSSSVSPYDGHYYPSPPLPSSSSAASSSGNMNGNGNGNGNLNGNANASTSSSSVPLQLQFQQFQQQQQQFQQQQQQFQQQQQLQLQQQQQQYQQIQQQDGPMHFSNPPDAKRRPPSSGYNP